MSKNLMRSFYTFFLLFLAFDFYGSGEPNGRNPGAFVNVFYFCRSVSRQNVGRCNPEVGVFVIHARPMEVLQLIQRKGVSPCPAFCRHSSVL